LNLTVNNARQFSTPFLYFVYAESK